MGMVAIYTDRFTVAFANIRNAKVAGSASPGALVLGDGHCSLFLILFANTCIGSCNCCATGQIAQSSLGWRDIFIIPNRAHSKFVLAICLFQH